MFRTFHVLPLLGLVAALASGCHTRAATVQAMFGRVGSVADIDPEPYIAVARSIITHAPPPAAIPPERLGQRAFVTWWSPGHHAVRGTGLGKTLLESVRLASEEVAKTATGGGRVELDVVVDAEARTVLEDAKMAPRRMGLYGYAIYDNDKHFGWVTPNEMVEDKLIDAREEQPTALKTTEISKRLELRAGVTEGARSVTEMRFKTDEWLESSTPGRAPVPLFRSMPSHPSAKDITPELLLEAVRDAADYLARSCSDEGRFDYLYDPVTDESGKGYEMLRHAGAVYALLEAYSETRSEPWLAAADRAVSYLEHRLTASPNGSYFDQVHEEQQKVGGAGLSLIALVRYTELTHDKRHLETMHELARFIVHQQYPDGHFRANADVEREDPTFDTSQFHKEVSYYAGEAVLGLIRLYAIDPDPKWLAAARKGADYIVETRDARTSEKHLIQDHWMSYAFLDLYGVTKEQRYADHAFKIGHAIVKAEIRDAVASERDYIGAFFDKGPTTPSSTRLEALAAQIQLARWMGHDEAWLRGPAIDIARFTIGQQLRGDALYFAKNPERAKGGLRDNLLSSDIRIDFPQHALCAWLRLARELRDPEWGKLERKLDAQ